MYLIPSFFLIPIILLALYWLNRHHDKKINENIDNLITPIQQDELFDSPILKSTKSPASQITPVKNRSKLTAEQRLAKEAEIKALRASLKKIQDNKLNLKKGSKKR